MDLSSLSLPHPRDADARWQQDSRLRNGSRLRMRDRRILPWVSCRLYPQLRVELDNLVQDGLATVIQSHDSKEKEGN